MPAISFTVPRFKTMIPNGSKHQTIRPNRKKPIKIGDTLYLFWKQRTAYCERLLTSVCTDLQDFAIDTAGVMTLDGTVLDLNQSTALAQADGFDSLPEFAAFFKSHHGLPFEGVVIHWQP